MVKRLRCEINEIDKHVPSKTIICITDNTGNPDTVDVWFYSSSAEHTIADKRREEYTRICICGDHIDLLGNRDYKFLNGEYYCVDCM